MAEKRWWNRPGYWFGKQFSTDSTLTNQIRSRVRYALISMHITGRRFTGRSLGSLSFWIRIICPGFLKKKRVFRSVIISSKSGWRRQKSFWHRARCRSIRCRCMWGTAISRILRRCLRTIRDTHRWNTEEALVKNSGKPPFTCPGNNRGFYHFLTHRNSSKQVGIVKEKGRIRGYFFQVRCGKISV